MDAVYALRGKLKNVRQLSDLAGNTEIVDLINILNLNLEDKGAKCPYQKIIIACDQDYDGIGHIASLIINFFSLWFPKIVDMNKLYILQTPLATLDVKNNRKYYYNLSELPEHPKGELRYLKGLGSLAIKDWEYVFKNLRLSCLKRDEQSAKFLNIAFGENSLLRKNWLKI
jgi:DNA gyrase/topoisomerase IV subunit B